MIIKILNDAVEFAHYFAEIVVSQLNKIEKTDFLNIALSGGSTPKAIFKVLASDYHSTLNWQKIRLYWGDERCVVPEDEESNYKMTREYLLDHIPIPNDNIFRILGEDDPENEATRYEDLVKNQLRIINGIPQFDIIMLGLGEDGHTASIFPDNLKLFETERFFVPSQNPYNKQNRISITGKLINHASIVLFLVTGKSKAEMVARIIKQVEKPSKFPASFVKPEKGELLWLLDKEAASMLNSLDELYKR
jgi:6-phosphogluconolactonase